MLEFVARRLEQLLVDRGCSVEAARAVLAERAACPASAALSARELQVSPLPVSCQRPFALRRDCRPDCTGIPLFSAFRQEHPAQAQMCSDLSAGVCA